MAEGHRSIGILLSDDGELPKRGSLRDDHSDSSGIGLGGRQHRRRHGREHTKTFVHFLRVPQGSLKELETHLIIAQQVGLLNSDEAQALFQATEEIGRMLRALIRSLEKRVANRVEKGTAR
jgi:23S rRNA-intervening sequence protein